MGGFRLFLLSRSALSCVDYEPDTPLQRFIQQKVLESDSANRAAPLTIIRDKIYYQDRNHFNDPYPGNALRSEQSSHLITGVVLQTFLGLKMLDGFSRLHAEQYAVDRNRTCIQESAS